MSQATIWQRLRWWRADAAGAFQPKPQQAEQKNANIRRLDERQIGAGRECDKRRPPRDIVTPYAVKQGGYSEQRHRGYHRIGRKRRPHIDHHRQQTDRDAGPTRPSRHQHERQRGNENRHEQHGQPRGPYCRQKCAASAGSDGVGERLRNIAHRAGDHLCGRDTPAYNIGLRCRRANAAGQIGQIERRRASHRVRARRNSRSPQRPASAAKRRSRPQARDRISRRQRAPPK